MKKLIFALLVSFANLLALFPLRAQPQADEQPEHRKNYYSCLHGYSGCDSSLLTDAERTQVSQAAHQRNFNNCLHGYSGCDSFQLADVERTQVQQAAHQRNFNNCLHGYSGCNSSQLTASEQASITVNKRDGAAAEP